MSVIKYLLDEHVELLLKKVLKKFSSDMVVWRIGDITAPPLGTLDPDILRWCEKSSFLLVTNNRASMPVHLREHLANGRHAPGIFVLNGNMTIGETVNELATIWGASEAEEYQDQLWFLPVTV